MDIPILPTTNLVDLTDQQAHNLLYADPKDNPIAVIVPWDRYIELLGIEQDRKENQRGKNARNGSSG